MSSDLRYALRSLAKSPAFTLVAVVIVAIGIGAATAMFSTVNALALRPIDLPESRRLAVIYETNLSRGVSQFSVSLPNYLDWKDRARSWSSLAAVSGQTLNLTGEAEAEMVRAPRVTANFLRTLGVRPEFGRDFLETEDRPGTGKVAILSGSFWQRRFGGDPGMVQRNLTLNGESYEIVGITPANAAVPIDFDVLLPLAVNPSEENRMDHYLDVFGRLADGVTLEQADAEMRTIAAQIFAELPDEDRGWSTRIISLENEIVGDSLRQGLYVLLAAVAVLLVIACANLSNLVLVRSTARTHELAVRTALGASRARLVRQLVTETLLVTGAGGGIGLLIAWWSIDALRMLPLPRAAEISADPRVLVAACAATILSGLLAGIGPALRASHQQPQDALRSRSARSGHRSRLRDGMVIAQVALSLTLLIGATLLVHSFWRLLKVQPGFNPEQVVTLALNPTKNKVSFYEAVAREVSALPGVTHTGFISRLPLTAGDTQNEVYPIGPSILPAETPTQASWRLIYDDYFGAMQIPLRRGQDFRNLTPAEARSSVVISESLARTLWGDEDPIGRQIFRANDRFKVIGVAGDVRSRELGVEAAPAFYMSIHRFTYGWQALVVRTDGELAPLVPALRQIIRRIDPTVPVFEVRTMNDIRSASLVEQKLLIALLASFAAVALLLTALGTYGVVAFTVQQRTNEFGIRLAIGAQPVDVLRLVFGQSMKRVAIGLALGLAGAVAANRVLASLLYETPPTDAVSYIVATLALTAVALLATLIPARRATRVDPMIALRAE